MKYKMLTGMLVTAMLTAAVISPVSASVIKVDGMLPVTALDTVTVGEGVEMIEADTLFDFAGANHSFNKYKKLYTASKGNTSIVIDTETGAVKAMKPNDEGVVTEVDLNLPQAPYTVEKGEDENSVNSVKVYVPMKAVGEFFGLSVKWDKETRTINIDTNKDNGYIMLETNTGDADAETRVISFDEALKLAKKKSSTLKSLDDSEEYMQDVRENLSDSIFQINQYENIIENQIISLNDKLSYTDADDRDTLETNLISAQQSMQTSMESFVTVARNIKQIELQQSMLDVNKEMTEDGIELTLMNYLTTIRSTESQISLLEESVELGKENISNMELKYSLGYESEAKLKSAKTTQASSETSLEALKLTLANAKQNLKTFLGVDSNENIYIDYDFDNNEVNQFFDELKLESFVTKKTESDPSIITLKNDVAMKKYIVRTNVVYENEIKSGVQNDLMNSQRKLSDAQDSMEKNIRNTYNNILQLEDMSNSYKQDIEQAVADYNTALISFNAGTLTEYQVKQAKLGIINAEKQYDDNKLKLTMLKFELQHPYLLQ